MIRHEGYGANATWTAWNEDNVYTCTSASSSIWTIWNSVYPTGTIGTLTVPHVEYVQERLPIAIRHAQMELDEADKKARALLRSLLTAEQRAQMEQHNYFEVHTNGKRYRIRRGAQGNIYRVDDAGREFEKFCIHARLDYPVEDQMIAQKLLLEADEVEFLRIANKTPLFVRAA